MIVCHRDSKEPEVFRLAGSQYLAVQRASDGWLTCDTLGIRFRRMDTASPRLRIEDLNNPLAIEI